MTAPGDVSRGPNLGLFLILLEEYFSPSLFSEREKTRPLSIAEVLVSGSNLCVKVSASFLQIIAKTCVTDWSSLSIYDMTLALCKSLYLSN